ncbi:MAG TPA: MaoC family dehydratase N-terminal domain-containing protein [Caulobacteraceae bacterium]|jgi:hypothetical protein|nr:MaoC family dehydratase N-terminal domain-containing protein [Caulobacteraceae bacterium]
MVDTSHIGYRHPPHTVDVEAGKLRSFAKAIGETRSEYLDEAAARAAGYRALPAPPTYMFSLELDHPDPFALVRVLKIKLHHVLHGTQRFIYHRPVCAGDRITLQQTVEEVFEKNDGALGFVVVRTTATNQLGELAGEAVKTIVVRQKKAKAS